jgi:hypothetical protein
MGFFLLLAQLAPAIIELVKAIEKAIPGKGHGPAKLDLVLKTIDTATAATPETAKVIAGHNLKTAVVSIVNATVETLNATGVFVK